MNFLFTDIEGSTRLWEKYGDDMAVALQQHDAILQNEIGRWGGQIIKHTGDGIFAVFPSGNPLEFALHVQRQLRAYQWGAVGELRVRYAIHAGQAQHRNGDYFGATINQTTRLLATGRGEQILLTATAARAICMPSGTFLRQLGSYRLKGLSQPLTVFELRQSDEERPTFLSRLRRLCLRSVSPGAHLVAIRHLAHSFLA
ncbi:MAG: adenylate/guanylate cyclase domain-containing protein [Anaerolineales bacterium]|nr:adenylate/guanylate cyclase domain-containing protein [Anaerolineales bacterium]